MDRNDIDRATALEVLKDISRYMYASHDIFGDKTLVIRRETFEAVRHKYLDNVNCTEGGSQ